MVTRGAASNIATWVFVAFTPNPPFPKRREFAPSKKGAKARDVGPRLCGRFGASRIAARPVGFEDESLNAGACRRQVDLGYGDGPVAETIANDEKVVTAGCVEPHRPALAKTVTRESLRIIADDTEGTLDDFFCH